MYNVKDYGVALQRYSGTATQSTVYNVKDYGAVGDNKTLNTLAIQKALDQAKASGGKVLTPAGEYLCGPLNVCSKTNLELGGVNN